MKPLRRLFVCVVIGFVLTVVISLAASILAQPGAPELDCVVAGMPEWEVKGTIMVKVSNGVFRTDLWLDPGPYPKRNVDWSQRKIEAPRWVRSVAQSHAGPRFAGWMARVAAYGWPRPVLYWIWDWRDEAVEGGLDTTKRNAATKSKEASTALPWRVLWRNLAFNTLAIAVVMWLAVTSARFLRVRIRRMRGRCSGCGYSREGLLPDAACPECGAVGKAVAGVVS